MLALIAVVRNEWTNMKAEDLDDEFDETDSIYNGPLDEIENTYINCHSYIAGAISKEVYMKDRSYCKFIIVYCLNII